MGVNDNVKVSQDGKLAADGKEKTDLVTINEQVINENMESRKESTLRKSPGKENLRDRSAEQSAKSSRFASKTENKKEDKTENKMGSKTASQVNLKDSLSRKKSQEKLSEVRNSRTKRLK